MHIFMRSICWCLFQFLEGCTLNEDGQRAIMNDGSSVESSRQFLFVCRIWLLETRCTHEDHRKISGWDATCEMWNYRCPHTRICLDERWTYYWRKGQACLHKENSLGIKVSFAVSSAAVFSTVLFFSTKPVKWFICLYGCHIREGLVGFLSAPSPVYIIWSACWWWYFSPGALQFKWD